MKFVTASEAVQKVKKGDRVFLHTGAMSPTVLLDALADRYQEVNDVEFVGILQMGRMKCLEEPYNKSFKMNSLFVSAQTRETVRKGEGEYTPVFLSETHKLFRHDILCIDVAMITVSPPDAHGFCSFGVSVDISLPAIEKAKVIIAQVNPNAPRTHGDGQIHVSEIDAMVEVNDSLHSLEIPKATEIDRKIGSYVAELIDDGATLQLGIGAVPNVVLENLTNHKKLGIHTEMLSDGVLPLIESGVITGSEKLVKPNTVLTCFALGTQKLYDYVNDNPIVHFKESAYTNAPCNIQKNPKVIAVNSAIAIDLTGQICADTIGNVQYSGVGGQVDFTYGASLSDGGKPIFAFSSRTGKGMPKIVPQLSMGSGITTTRAHVHYVATEYGVVNLFGKSTRERAKALISIAHPEDREELSRQAREVLKLNI